MQVAPFAQGELAHSSMGIMQRGPLNPDAQTQL
jgi:hypothetical protein